ncbi:4-coumarate--CoA ligase [Elysia marginata]|uniref:4-coumarate--CoA ligase n=1 Tax=Elysia marginata TaxID=1093978 RepID=A0AAV4GDG3_9GAST|nr:4-coumarate--CoA ligase [Elysia marginata]
MHRKTTLLPQIHTFYKALNGAITNQTLTPISRKAAACYNLSLCQHKSVPRAYSSFTSKRQEYASRDHNTRSTKQPSVCLFSSKQGGQSSHISPDFILSSPFPDIDIPSDIAFHEYMFQFFDAYGDSTAVKDFLSGESYTYPQLEPTARKIASGLYRAGLRKGDVLLCVSINLPDVVVLMLACSCLGVLYSSANPGFTPAELARQLEDCEASVLVTIPQLADTVNKALNSKNFNNKIKNKYVFGQSSGFEPFSVLKEDDGLACPNVSINPKEDVLLLPYSSGTTGFPKGVMLTHYNVVANLYQAEQLETVNRDENVILLLPMYHIFGQVVVQYCTLIAGSQLVTVPTFEPDLFLKCLQDAEISTAHLVPPLINFMAKDPRVANYNLTALKRIICSAAPLSKELTEDFLKRINHGVAFTQGYGQTECSPAACYDLGMKRIGSVGKPISNTHLKFLDIDSGKAVGPNQSGEVYIKGPQVMKGYWKNEEATKSTLMDDGWIATGDIGYYTEDGYVYIEDRLKELIKYKGSQVAPAEIEALLLTHPEIQEAAVIGVPDERAGEVPRAFVVKKQEAAQLTEQQVVDFVAEDLRISWKEHKTHEEVLQADVTETARLADKEEIALRWSFYKGELGTSFAASLEGRTGGRRGSGRPKRSWTDDIKQ